MALDWGGAKIVSLERGHPGRHLCEGTPATCPTPALLAAEKAGEKIPAERWKHHCTGLLGEFQGNNLHWMECTEFFGKGKDELGQDLLDYLDRGGSTALEAGGVDALPPDRQPAKWKEFSNKGLLLPEEQVDRFRQFAARLLGLGVRALKA